MTRKLPSTATKIAFASLCFASLACGSAEAEPLLFKNLALINGWARYSLDTANAAAALDPNNVIHLKGAIYQPSGSTAVPFVLQAKFRPNRVVHVPVDLVNGRNGRLIINPNGTVFVQAGGVYSDAQSFTSLEGVTYSKN